LIVLTIARGVMFIEEDDRKANVKKVWNNFLWGSIIVTFLSCIVPTKTEFALIYLVPKVGNSQFVNETLPKESEEIFQMFKTYLKQELENKK
jgi:hypothetical protein